MTLEELYQQVVSVDSDIQYHLPLLKGMANNNKVVEFGVREGNSTIALLAGKPKWLRSYDIRPFFVYPVVKALLNGTDFCFQQRDSLEVPPVECDVLFIDTLHTYYQLKAELDRHGKFADRIVIHDTTLFGAIGEDEGKGLIPAISDWLIANGNYMLEYETTKCNGLMVLARCEGKQG